MTTAAAEVSSSRRPRLPTRVKANAAVLVCELEVAVTVTGTRLAASVPPERNTSWPDDCDGEMTSGSALIPAGNPAGETSTTSANPSRRAMVTVAAAVPRASSVSSAGVMATVNAPSVESASPCPEEQAPRATAAARPQRIDRFKCPPRPELTH